MPLLAMCALCVLSLVTSFNAFLGHYANVFYFIFFYSFVLVESDSVSEPL